MAGAFAERAAVRHLVTRVSVPEQAIVAGYWPMADEFDDRPFLAHFADRGHDCVLPVITAKGEPLMFRRWRAGDELVANRLGIEEPGADAPALDPSVVLVPLLAFDGEGNRLGYGGGFYDRSLAKLRERGPVLAIGVAFAGQAMDEVPHGPNDQRLDWIVTEEGVSAFPQIAAGALVR